MAIKVVIPLPQERDGERDKDQTRLTRMFRVITNSRGDGPIIVSNAPGLPRYGEPYIFRNEAYPFAVVDRITPRYVEQTATGDVWDVAVEYSDAHDPQGKDQREPTQERADVRWTQSQRTVPWIYDTDGKLVANSADDPFDPTLTIEVFDSVLTVERWETAYDDKRAEEFRGKLNSGTFYGRPKRRARVMEIGGTRRWSFGQLLWRVSYQIEFRAPLPGQFQGEGWDELVIDQGYRRKVLDADGRTHLENILDETGNPLAQPAFLDGLGGVNPIGNEPVYYLAEKYDEIDFGSLNLENI